MKRPGALDSSEARASLSQEASQRGESCSREGREQSVEALRRKAEERVRYRSQERRREEQELRAREALKKCEVEEELRAAKEELEARRRSAAQRAASRQRREKESEDRARLDREEQTREAKERRQLYRNPRAIAELKAAEAPMPLTQEQRRSASRRRQAEQDKLRRYADGLPVEDGGGRPPPLPGSGGSSRVRRTSRKATERGRVSPSSSLQTHCSETDSALEPLEEPTEAAERLEPLEPLEPQLAEELHEAPDHLEVPKAGVVSEAVDVPDVSEVQVQAGKEGEHAEPAGQWSKGKDTEDANPVPPEARLFFKCYKYIRIRLKLVSRAWWFLKPGKVVACRGSGSPRN